MSFDMPQPSLSLIETYLANTAAFAGIGPKRAQALYAAFGHETLHVLRTPCEDVIAIIGEEPALNAAAALEVREAETAFLEWLEPFDISVPHTALIRLARAWGTAGINAIKANPYLLLAVAPWMTVDTLAQSLGMPSTDIRRQIGAIETVLQGPHGLEGGHTLVPHDVLRQETVKLLGFPLSMRAIKTCLVSGGAVERPEGFQPAGAAWMEQEVADALIRLASERLTSTSSLSQTAIPTQGFSLTEKQIEAIRLSQQTRLFVLGGYAGSGKTTALRSICAAHEAAGRTPLILTLSGRAAQRAREATNREAMTLAKFFVLHDTQKLALDESYALIIDEASMLSLPDFWRVIRRLNEAYLLLCGDPAQLPPIGFGLVFHRLFDRLDIRSVVLDQVMRQSAESGIPTFAVHVRQGIFPELTPPDGTLPGVSFMPCSRDNLLPTLENAIQLCENAGFTGEDVQIIAPTHRDISAINSHFHTKNLASGAASWQGQRRFCVGDPLIWTKNIPDRELTNGSMGRLVAGSTTPQALFDGNLVDLSRENQAYIDLAYAISIHKSQGSQWPCVIIPIFQNRLLDRALVYTAITRGMSHVILVGDKNALNSALTSQKAFKRRVSFCYPVRNHQYYQDKSNKG